MMRWGRHPPFNCTVKPAYALTLRESLDKRTNLLLLDSDMHLWYVRLANNLDKRTFGATPAGARPRIPDCTIRI